MNIIYFKYFYFLGKGTYHPGPGIFYSLLQNKKLLFIYLLLLKTHTKKLKIKLIKCKTIFKKIYISIRFCKIIFEINWRKLRL